MVSITVLDCEQSLEFSYFATAFGLRATERCGTGRGATVADMRMNTHSWHLAVLEYNRTETIAKTNIS